MMTLVLILILLWPALLLLRLLMIARLVLGLEFRHETVSADREAQILAPMREAARPWMAQLEQLGFRTVGGLRIMRMGDPVFEQPVVVMLLPEPPVRALIRPMNEAANAAECWVSLQSTALSGEEFLTSSYDPEPLVPVPEALKREILPTVAAAGLLSVHLERLAPLRGNLWNCPGLEGAAAREQQICDAIRRRMYNSGLFVDHRGGVLTYRPVEALRRAFLVLRHASQLKKLRNGSGAPVAPATLSDESLSHFDWQHYREMIAISSGRMSLRNKSVLSAVSLVLFALALAVRMHPVAALTLVVALVVHEVGHLVGMWCFGYRDTQMLFIPFLGGAAVGHDDKVLQPWQHIVIALLGPLPGLFAGMAIAGFHASGGGPEWLQTAAYTLIGLNAFNLLPILPLDGGRVLDYAVASRFPRARVVFLTLSAAGLALIGWGAADAGFLVGIGAAILFRTSTEWRLAGVRNEMREEFPEGGDTEPIVRRLLQRLRGPDFAKMSATARLQSARALQHVLRTPAPGFGTLGFALAAFTSPLWLAVPITLWAAVTGGERAIAKAEARAAAVGVKREVPRRPAAVSADENAAVPVARAEALLAEEPEAGDVAQAVALLRSAARKPVFVPIESRERPPRHDIVATVARGQAVMYLAGASDQQVRSGQNDEALAIAIDGLRLVRLLDSAPGWWTWETHERMTSLCWSAVEAALAAGAKPTPAVAAELRALSDDRTEIAFAVAAMPQMLLQRGSPARATDVGGLAAAADSLANMSGAVVRARTQAIDDAVVVHEHLQRIQKGDWPAITKPGGGDTSGALIARLGDTLARHRQARAALAWSEHQRSETLEGLGLTETELRHPLTREPLRLLQRGTVRVIACAGAGFAEVDGSATAIEWRLPTM